MRNFIEEHQDTINFIIAGVLLLAVVLIFSLIEVYMQQDQGEVVARVNDQPIYESELNERMKNLPPNLQETYSREMVLDQMIQELVLLQRIDELGLEVSDEKVEQELQKLFEQKGLDEESLDQVLKLQGVRKDDLKEQLRRQLLLDKLLEKELTGLNVSDEEARDYYNDNIQSFVEPRTAEIWQAIIPTSNRSNATANTQAQQVLDDAREQGFDQLCKLVSEYATNQESACGKYNITKRSGLPQSFVNASLEMNTGESRLIQTQFGYHIMYKVGEEEERVQSFTTVKEGIKRQLKNTKKKRAYRDYISRLRDDATIENYLLDEIIKNITRRKEAKSWNNITTCIANNTVLYGARWDTQTQKQLRLLGNASEKIRYVDCTLPDSVKNQRRICDQAGIDAYPTWFVNGEEELGVKTLPELAGATGCS